MSRRLLNCKVTTTEATDKAIRGAARGMSEIQTRTIRSRISEKLAQLMQHRKGLQTASAHQLSDSGAICKLINLRRSWCRENTVKLVDRFHEDSGFVYLRMKVSKLSPVVESPDLIWEGPLKGTE